MSPPNRKRHRTDDYSLTTTDSAAAEVRSRHSAFLASLNRGISPPVSRELSSPKTTGPEAALQLQSETDKSDLPSMSPQELRKKTPDFPKHHVVQSPFKLTRIRALPASANIDTIGIRDILGDVMLKEVWLFDFLYDVDWVMQQFDPDIRPIVSVVLVHGSWRREDSNKIHIDEASKRYPNVKVVTAYMPEMYGCHHSKCMVLFRHDDFAQVIVHTANMIEQDWRNLTQGVWLSPLLPIQAHQELKENPSTLPAIGTGLRFKRDFLAYLRYYSNRTTKLVSQLEQYDFAAVRAALIAHVPAKFDGKEMAPSAELWGWPALKRALGSIPPKKSGKENATPQTASHIVCQVSSIASLSDKWIRDTLFSTLATTSTPPARPSAKNPKPTSSNQVHPKFSVIFPTPLEIKTCLDGYAAGSSIHCKLQNAAQKKQFEFMKPYLCHWNAHPIPAVTPTGVEGAGGKALRGPAAPHIKTFISFHHDTTSTLHPKEIDWALLTSANMSTQAWGTAAQADSGEVRVSSYELGVLIWSELFLEEHNSEEGGRNRTEKRKCTAKMIPTFGSDTPTEADIRDVVAAHRACLHDKTGNDDRSADGESEEDQEEEEDLVTIGLRMPYDLPLTPYEPNDEVWSARSSYTEPDVFGRVWNI